VNPRSILRRHGKFLDKGPGLAAYDQGKKYGGVNILPKLVPGSLGLTSSGT